MKKIKNNTVVYGIRPEMVMVDSIVASVFAKSGYDSIITSGVGKKHSARSLHYPGYALDYRTKHIDADGTKLSIVETLKDALPCCDIVLEHVGGAQEHIHVEFDPKYDDRFQQDKKEYKQTGKWPE